MGRNSPDPSSGRIGRSSHMDVTTPELPTLEQALVSMRLAQAIYRDVNDGS